MDYNYKNRNEVPEKYRWDLTKYFKSDEDWYLEYEDLKKHINDLNCYKGKLFEADNLYDALDKFYTYNNRIEILYVYASLKQDEDLSVDKYGKMYSEICILDSEFNSNISFLMPEILHSKYFNINELIKKSPKLERFKHVLEEIELDRKYVKDEKTEELITNLNKDMHSYSKLASTLLNSDLNYGKTKDESGKSVELNTGNYIKFLKSADRNIRKSAYDKMNKKRTEFADTLGKNLISYMNRHAQMSKIRGYNSTKEMDFKNDYIPISVHDALLKNTKKGLPLFQNYYKKIANMLNLEKLSAYDLNAPISKNLKKYTVEEAQDLVYKSTEVLGKRYSDIIKKGFDERWIDYMPYKGKCSGGYCFSVYGKTSNILLSYNGVFDNISTIAHEMGHAVNAYLSFEKNNVEYAYHSLFLAEIASLTNEILLANYIIENDFSKEEKISVIIELLETINNNFFTAVMENELENIIYERIDKGEAISPNDLTITMDKLTKKYYGNSINRGKYMKYMWVKRSHYFTPWYLYKYATCICGAVHFSSRILNGDKNTLNSYLKFLESGNDKFPNDILLEYNMDLTNDKIYDELFEYYKYLLEKLDDLLGSGD